MRSLNLWSERRASPKSFVTIQRYGLAIVSVSLAFGASLILQHYQLQNGLLSLFLFATALTAWHVGVGPAALSIVLSTLCFDYFFMPPIYSFTFTVAHVPALVILVSFAVLITRFSPGDPNSLSPGKVTAIYQDSKDVLWLGFFPRALDRLDRKTGKITHYVPGPENRNALGKGSDVNGIYKDARGYLWLGGWGGGLDRFDERSGQLQHYRHNPDDPNRLLSDNVYTISGDRCGNIWVGQQYGITHVDPVTGQFTNYRPDPRNPTSYRSGVSGVYQDRSGTLWLGTRDGLLVHVDDKSKTLRNHAAESLDPHRLQGGGATAIHEDRAGILWVGAWDGLYRYNRQNGTFTRYTESQALASSVIQGILEDKAGRLWLSTKKGISRFDPQTETFRNFDGPRKLPVQTVFLTRCPRSVADCEQRQLDKRTA